MPARLGPRTWLTALSLGALLAPHVALAEGSAPSEKAGDANRSRTEPVVDDGTNSPEAPKTRPIGASERRELLREPEGYANLFGAMAFGGGFRFNNPYRLHTQLGPTASSVSTTAPYVDFAAAITFGSPNGLQHGGALHTGVSMSGPQQTYLSLTYLAAYRAGKPFLVYGRVGPTMLLSPDVNLGGELAGSFSYFFTGALGLTSELAFDLFYGAATLDKKYSVYPILSGQLGIIVNYEVLP